MSLTLFAEILVNAILQEDFETDTTGVPTWRPRGSTAFRQYFPTGIKKWIFSFK